MLDTMGLARRLVALHDDRGIPLAASIEMAVDAGIRLPLLGLVAEMAARNWGAAAVRESVGVWAAVYHDPTDAERVAVAAVRSR